MDERLKRINAKWPSLPESKKREIMNLIYADLVRSGKIEAAEKVRPFTTATTGKPSHKKGSPKNGS